MRFCQVDGTPLIDDAPAFDPYATIVGAAVTPKPPAAEKPAADTKPEPEAMGTGAEAIAPPADVLDVPEADPLKTMYVSDAEMMATLGKDKPEPEPAIIEVPPIETEKPAPAPVDAGHDKTPAPEAPAFSVPDVSPPNIQDFGPPPSPFSSPGAKGGSPVPAPPKFDEPRLEEPKFDEAATMIQSSLPTPFEKPPEPAKWTPPPPGSDLGKSFDPPTEKKSPFDPVPSAPMEAWTPPPAPEPSWQNKEAASASPSFQQVAGGGGENKGLAIGSLVTGILSCLCCFSVITGPAAVIMGFIAKKKADEEPTTYGGRSLALGGMITGAIGLVIGIALIILQFFFGALSALAQ